MARTGDRAKRTGAEILKRIVLLLLGSPGATGTGPADMRALGMPATGALANRPFAHAMQRLETSCSTGLMATIYGRGTASAIPYALR